MARERREEKSARLEALEQLLRIEQDQAYVGLAGDADAAPADRRAARQALEYVAGVTRWRRYLDFLIDHFYRGNPDRLELKLRLVLRLGIYELHFQETPGHAAVNEAVELAKKFVRPGAGGLVNGLLRSVQRTGDALPKPSTGDAAEDLAIRHSHPTWMVRRWMGRFSESETRQLLEWNNRRPHHSLVINTLKISVDDFRSRLTDAGVDFEVSERLPNVVRMRRLQPVVAAGFLAEGLCLVQDESAALVVRLLDPRPGETVVDTCAAPGGKSLHAAIRMRDEGAVISCDVHEGRLSLLRAAAGRYAISTITTRVLNARRVDPADFPPADRVLVDAPCSGHGVLSRRADLRWNRTESSIRELAALQDAILEGAAKLVGPGGLLVYSTCTIEPEENEERVHAFLDRHPEFAIESAEGFVPAEMVTSEGFYASLPFRDGIDGAFGVRLRQS